MASLSRITTTPDLTEQVYQRLLYAICDGELSPGARLTQENLAATLGVSRQSMSNHLTCLRGCGLVVAVPDGRRTRYELADPKLGHAIRDLLGVVLAVDPVCCAPDGTCLA